MQHLSLNNDERKALFDALAETIDQSQLTMDEFIFASSDLLKTHFWMSLTANKPEEEIVELRTRISDAVIGTVGVLEKHTDNTAEDMIVLYSVILEAVNHIFAQIKANAEHAQEAQELVE